MKKQNLKERKGITLVALVVTIVVLIILATITITIVVGENGLINRAKQVKTLQEGSQAKEELDMILLGYNLKNQTNKAQGGSEQTLKAYLEGEDGVSNVKEKGNNLIVTFKGSQYTVNKTTLASGAYQSQGLKVEDEEKVVNALKNETNLLTVNYEPTPTDSTYIVPDKYSGVDTTQDDLTVGQTFTQAGLLGTGSNKLNWYVLSTDEEGVNLVSDVTKASITFADSPGYDNSLYYLDKVSKEFFSNESQFGVTKDRVHALNLTDIKKAAEQVNAGVKVGERDWNWDESVLGKAKTNTNKTSFQDSANYTDSYRYYPGIYTDVDGDVNCNNPLYDEKVKDQITNDTGIKARGLAGTKLTVNNTSFWFNSKADNLTALGKGTTGTVGNSKIGDTLFTGNYWLATRCIYANSGPSYADYAGFDLFSIYWGAFTRRNLCSSDGYVNNNYILNPFRVVVSVPASHITVADDGTVTLK